MIKLRLLIPDLPASIHYNIYLVNNIILDTII